MYLKWDPEQKGYEEKTGGFEIKCSSVIITYQYWLLS